jgi:hypothetical protein
VACSVLAVMGVLASGRVVTPTMAGECVSDPCTGCVPAVHRSAHAPDRRSADAPDRRSARALTFVTVSP